MENTNVLLAHLKKPKLTIDLPTRGEFWPPESLTQTTDLPVYAMTGQDEMLMLNVSPVLLSSILAEIIGNCIPAIKDVWSMPQVDLDTVMIAIRCASYNTKMNNSYKCPHCEARHDYSVDLQESINKIKIPNYQEPISVGDAVIWFKPLTYRENFQNSLDQNRKMAVIRELQKEDISEEEQQRIINSNLRDITAINISTMALNISKVSVSDSAVVSNSEHIKEWLLNVDRESFDQIKSAIENKNNEYQLPLTHVTCKSCAQDFENELDFNAADFLKKGE